MPCEIKIVIKNHDICDKATCEMIKLQVRHENGKTSL